MCALSLSVPATRSASSFWSIRRCCCITSPRDTNCRRVASEDNAMKKLTRRKYLAASAGFLAAGGAGTRGALALDPVRQGYQTNIWGMPTYYLLKSGLLEKHGIKFEEFAVPSGNLTMQQMVARQVDLGTYAGQS